MSWSPTSGDSAAAVVNPPVLVITGPSGVGKGTLIRRLLSDFPGAELSVSATTREPRDGEVNGRDYHFLSGPEFERRLVARGAESADQIERRLAVAREELAAQDEFRHKVVNTDAEEAAQELIDLAATMCVPEVRNES